MTPENDELNLTLQIVRNHDELDAEELAQLTQALMRNLEDVGVESVIPVWKQENRPGAKGDATTFGVLLVAVLPTVLPKVLDFLQTWAVRNNDHMIKAKVQRGDQSVEIEYAENIPMEKLQYHVELIKQMMEEDEK